MLFCVFVVVVCVVVLFACCFVCLSLLFVLFCVFVVVVCVVVLFAYIAVILGRAIAVVALLHCFRAVSREGGSFRLLSDDTHV